MVALTFKRSDFKNPNHFETILAQFQVPTADHIHIESFEIYPDHLQALDREGMASGFYWVEVI